MLRQSIRAFGDSIRDLRQLIRALRQAIQTVFELVLGLFGLIGEHLEIERRLNCRDEAQVGSFTGRCLRKPWRRGEEKEVGGEVRGS